MPCDRTRTAKSCSPTSTSRRVSSRWPTRNNARDLRAWQGKKAIRSFARKLAEPEVIKDLNITPMMDMMTIILVFLLKSFSSTTSTITFDQNLQVPKSFTQLKPKLAVTVTVTKKVILVEGDAIAPINAGASTRRSSATARTATTSRRSSTSSRSTLGARRKVAELTGPEVRRPADDRRRPDDALPPADRIIYSCGQAGYANYRLLVLKAKAISAARPRVRQHTGTYVSVGAAPQKRVRHAARGAVQGWRGSTFVRGFGLNSPRDA